MNINKKREAEKWLEEKLLEGLNSPRSEFTAQDWIDIRKEAYALLKSRKKERQ